MSELWIRFHSLPESRRYAETEDDAKIIRHRQNTLAAKVLGDKTACWMSSFLWDGLPCDNDWYRTHHAIYERYQMSKVDHVTIPDDETDYDIYAALMCWETNHFDDILRQIANDEARFMWTSVESGAVFAPYDGGIDLIVPSLPAMRALISEHSDWLSTYPGGY